MYKLADISIWFTKENRELKAIVERRYAVPCKSSPRGMVPNKEQDSGNRKKVHDYFTELAKHEPLYCTTITIGQKYVGCMSYHDQYSYILKILKVARSRNNVIKCCYHWELTGNGQIHLHGIETGGYSQNFADAFGVLGKHNQHTNSYVKCIHTNLSGYLRYINKENIKPFYYNISNNDLNQMLMKIESQHKETV